MTSDTQLREIDGSQEERIARRVAELYETDPQFRAAAPLPKVIEAACTPGLRLTQIFETIIEGYADRPALDAVAAAISYAISEPDWTDVNEIVVRPAGQRYGWLAP
jgi:hypothetical protein